MPTREQASTGFSHRPSSCQPGCVRLSAHLRRLYNLGDSGCLNALSKLSSGAPSWHAYGKAIDLTCNFHDPAQAARGNQCIDWVYLHREELNLQQMIGAHRIYDVAYGGFRYYHHDDHFTHIHIAIGYQASQSWMPHGAPAPAPAPKKAKPMNFIQVHGGNAIAVSDSQSKIIMKTPHMLGEFQWLCAVQGGNIGVSIVSQETWDILPTVNAG